ncbi:hypothetical protein B0O40_1860 [Ruminococcaceae bacterium R-25]|nr:hypothetical protein B0O40_1860 [Ruminococcaceae bacterium R-25]SUQ21723.1 hypothetical protein SAMN06297423_1860 [Oscillospiraceae bacterium]
MGHRYSMLSKMWIVIPYAIFALAYGIYNREFPGLDPINATVYVVAGLLLIPSYIQAPRTYALAEIRRYGASEMPVFSRNYTYKRVGSSLTWAGVGEKSFRIEFSASEQGTKNCQEVLKVMKSKPWIIWLQPGVWLAVSIAILVLNIFLDNPVSSLFASMGSGTEIATLRIIVFYMPCVLALVCPILSFIFVVVRDNILYKCAEKLANEIEADLTARAGSPMKCYRNVCPNCGVVSTSSLKCCNNCGTSLEVLDSTMGLGTLRYYRDDD